MPLIRHGTTTTARIPINVPSSTSDAAQTEMPDLAARFADVAKPPASTSLRVDVPTLVLWGMQDPVCLQVYWMDSTTMRRMQSWFGSMMRVTSAAVTSDIGAIRDFLR